jgi:hypothetical protein
MQRIPLAHFKSRGTPRTRRAARALYAPLELPTVAAPLVEATEPPKPWKAIGGSAGGITPAKDQLMPKHEELKTEIVAEPPQGLRKALNLSAAYLLGIPYDDRAAFARSGGPAGQKCGVIYGAITHGVQHPNKKYEGDSIRWVGTIGFQARNGTLGTASNAYLPGTVGRDLENQGISIIREGSGQRPEPFLAEFSVELWIEPAAASVSGAHYIYACYDLTERQRHPIDHLAPPAIRALLPKSQERQLLGYDPETGEIDEPSEPEVAEAAE